MKRVDVRYPRNAQRQWVSPVHQMGGGADANLMHPAEKAEQPVRPAVQIRAVMNRVEMRQTAPERVDDHRSGDRHPSCAVAERCQEFLPQIAQLLQPAWDISCVGVKEGDLTHQLRGPRRRAVAVEHVDVIAEIAQRVAEVSGVGGNARAVLETEITSIDHHALPGRGSGSRRRNCARGYALRTVRWRIKEFRPRY